MAETLLEEVNPNGNIQAVVESDDDTCYFYLFAAPHTQLGTKSVWVRNHRLAPEALEVERLRSGSPSRNPARHCRHTAGRAAPAAEDLRVVWLPEGNGAALYERDEILAIIPPWSGINGFYGYARDNIGEGRSRGNLIPIMFCSNVSNKHNSTGENGTIKNSGHRSSHLRYHSPRKHLAVMLNTTQSTRANGRRRRWCALRRKTARSSSRSA